MSYRLTGQCAARFFADGLYPSVPIQRQFFRRQGRQRQVTELGCGQDTDDGTWPLSALFFRQYLSCIAIQQIGDARELCAASIPPDPAHHFRFCYRCPLRSFRFCTKRLDLQREPLALDLRLPPDSDAVLVFSGANCCHICHLESDSSMALGWHKVERHAMQIPNLLFNMAPQTGIKPVT